MLESGDNVCSLLPPREANTALPVLGRIQPILMREFVAPGVMNTSLALVQEVNLSRDIPPSRPSRHLFL
jgi:hypothetical protein